jgi:hypothetical protein
MNYDFSKIGVTVLAATRSKTQAEKDLMLLDTDGKCWVDHFYPGLCAQKGKRLSAYTIKKNVKTVRAGHIIAHSKGGDDCVPMCDSCNADQSALPLYDYVLVLEGRFKRLYPRLDRFENLLYTEFL